MSILNAFLRAVFDVALAPFRELHPLVGLTLISLLVGVAMLYIFKLTSDQDQLAVVKRRIHAGLFEIRLFNDDLRAILRAQLDILRHNLSYIRLSLKPLLWMIVPFVLLVGQLHFHYGYRGLRPGEATVLKVELAEDWQARLGVGTARPPVSLEAPAGLRVETGPVWLPSQHELSWRIVAEDQGSYDVTLRLAEQEVTKNLQVAGNVARRSPVRPSSGFFDQLLFPAEAPLPSDLPITSIAVDYPDANAGFLGWESEWTWMGIFFILSIVFAFAFRKPLGVTI